MIRRQGHVPMPEASRYLQRLCHHVTKKITVTYDTARGDAALHFDCTAADPESLARVQYAIVVVSWREVEAQADGGSSNNGR